jgi:hypothetical protein
LICSVCKKSRNDITRKNSILIPGINVYLCNECLAEKREPRWLIVLAGRSGRFDAIRPFLKNRRYVGDDITAEELHV